MVKILLDTADIKVIEEIASYYDISGITTNRTILSRVEKNLDWRLERLRNFCWDKYEIHIETTENEANKIVEEAKSLRKYFGEKFFIKIPITKEGLIAIKKCREENINVTATAILSVMQALAAAKQGANYVAPYINRMENIGYNGEQVIKEMSTLIAPYNTEILAASFKNVAQFKNILLSGAEAATVQPSILEASLWHPYTDKSIKDFEYDWESKFESKKIVDYLLN